MEGVGGGRWWRYMVDRRVNGGTWRPVFIAAFGAADGTVR